MVAQAIVPVHIFLSRRRARPVIHGGHPVKLPREEEELVLEHRRKNGKPTWRPTVEYSITEKIVAFDRLHAEALRIYNHVLEHGYKPKNCKESVFEHVMELLGDGVWPAYTALYKGE
jgi:hypothetical protein